MRSLFLLVGFFVLFLDTQAQTLHVIESGNFFYDPSSLTINVGDTVQWINVDGFHNVNGETSAITGVGYNNPESFFSSPTSDEILFTKVFTIAGTYEYDCSVGMHAANGMVGTLIVEPLTSTSEVKDENIEAFYAFYSTESNQLKLEFKLKNNSANAVIQLYNTAGQCMQTEKIYALDGENTHLMDLKASLAKGIYFVSLHVDNARITEKIVIQY